jgi:tetratricopeptide (TPR) repeat protein
MGLALRYGRLYLLAPLAVLLWAELPAAQAPREDEALQTFALAYGAFKDGLDQLAETQFRAFLERHPRHERVCEARFLLGELLCRNGRRPEGLQEYEKVYAGPQACPMALDARMRAAAELRQAGEPSKALPLLQAVLRAARPAQACEAGLQACELLLPLGQWSDLEATARAAAASCPPSAPTELYRAMAHSALGQHEQAVELATAGLRLDLGAADRRRMLLLRGENYYRLDAIGPAIVDLEPALAVEPSQSGDVLLALARIRVGPPREADSAVRRLVQRHPSEPRLPEVRRLLLEALCGPLEDREALQRQIAALRAGDLQPEAAQALAARLRKRGWLVEATDLLGLCAEPACQMRLASIWLEEGRPERALAVAEGLAGQTGGIEDERRILLSAALVKLGRVEEAIAVYGDVADSAASPEAAQRALLLEAQLCSDLKRWPEAIVTLQSLLVRSPPAELDRSARLLLANAYLRSGQSARGATVLEELEPKTDGALRIEILWRLAHAHTDAGGFASAIGPLQRLIERLPAGSEDWGKAVLELGQAYLRAGDSEHGRSVLQSLARQLPPDSPRSREILLGIAALHAAEGSHNLAAEQYERLLPDARSVEERATLVLRLGSAYYRSERYTEAIRVLGSVDPSGPQGLAALLELGLCHEQLGQVEQAAAVFERLLNTSSDRAEAARHLLRLARRGIEEKHPELARRLLEEVLASAPATLAPEARFELAGLELEAGNRDVGLSLLKQNSTQPPVDPRWACLSTLRAAALFEAEQSWDQAERLYQELLQRFPDDPMAPYARSRLRQVQTQAGRPRALDKDLADRPPRPDTAGERKDG